VGLVGRLAEPINLADAQKHPSFKYIPSVKEERFRAFLVCRLSSVASCSACWFQQRELRQYDESEESFLRWPRRWRRSSQSQLAALGQYRHTRIRAFRPARVRGDCWRLMDATLPL
jgi:phosphotransferase system enzyme I (PtsP)